jgi:hypothetical protein
MRAWLGSAAIHAAAAAWLVLAVADDRPRFRMPTLPVGPARRPDSQAIEVDVVSFAAATRSHGNGNGGGGSRSIGSFAAAPAPSADEPGLPVAPPSPGTSPLLHMRALDLRVHDETLAPAQALDAPDGPSRIAWSHDGRGVVHDRVTTMHIDPDGTAHLQDTPDFDIDLPLPSLNTLRHLPSEIKGAPEAMHQMLRDWYQNVQVEQAYLEHYDRRQHLDEIPNGCADYAELNCVDPDVPPVPKDPGDALVHGQADVSSWLERKLVGDPYASRKKKLLEDTFAERAEHGKAYRADQLVHAAERMHANLEQLWASTRDAATRRRIVFELWNECTDDDAGQRARAIVMLWVRERLPAGGVDAYTPDELARFAGFQPY